MHAAKGYYGGADAFISYHPHFANTAIWDTQCGSYWSAVFTFETVAPEKWADKSLIPTTRTSHAAARCPGAIDALPNVYDDQIWRQDNRRDPARPADRAGPVAAGAGRVPRPYRRRHRRHQVGPAVAAQGFQPPIDLRWPEYIQTARGEEWWIPTPTTGSGTGEPL